MSDFHDIPTYPKARKRHVCSACCAGIPVGEKYVQQTGFFDGSAYRNKYHQECWDLLTEEGIFEFCPGDLEPPERLLVPAVSTPTLPLMAAIGDDHGNV